MKVGATSLIRNNWHLLALFILFLSSLFSVQNSFNPGYLASWDNHSHLVKAAFMEESINLERAGVWGWFTGWYEGCAPFIIYAPLFSFVVVLIRGLSLHILSLNESLKLVVALMYSFFPLLIYWFCRQFDFRKKSAVFAAVFSLTVSNIAGVGIEAIYGIGLYPHFLGILLLIVYLGLLHRSLEDDETKKYLSAGLVLGFIVLTHSITTVYAFVATATYLLTRFLYCMRINKTKFMLILLTGFLLSLFWVYPLLSSFDLFGPDAAFYPFSFGELVRKILFENAVVDRKTILFFAAGFLFTFSTVFYEGIRKDKKTFSSVFLILLVFITVLVSSNCIVEVMKTQKLEDTPYKTVFRVFDMMLKTRALSYLGILLPAIAGKGLGDLLDLTNSLIGRRLNLFGKHSKKTAAALYLLLFFIVVSCLVYAYSSEQIKTGKAAVRIVEIDYKQQYAPWDKLFVFLREKTEPNALIKANVRFNEIRYPGFFGVDSLIVLNSDRRVIGGGQIELLQIDLFNYIGGLDYISVKADSEAESLLHKTDLDYYLFVGNGSINKDYFEKVYDDANKIKLYKVRKSETDGYLIVDKSFGENALGFLIRVADAKELNVSLPVQYNDHWVAQVNGEEVPALKSSEGLLSLPLRHGFNEVKLYFKRKNIETFFFLVSLATFLVVVSRLIPSSKIKK